MKLHSVLCLFLLAGNGHAALWNKNGKNKNQKDLHRRRLTEVPAETVDADAATGTVRQAVPEEEAARTCDGEMAQSLVDANEKMMNAQAERDEAIAQKAQSLDRLAFVEKSLADLREVKGQLERKVGEVEKAKHEQAGEFEKKVDQMANAHIQELDTMTGHVEELASLNDEMESNFSEQIQDLEDTIKEMEDQHRREIAELEAQRKKIEKEAAETLAKKEEDARATLKKVKDAKDKKIEAANGRAKKAEEEVLEAEEELTRWRATHENRTYCNYTFVSEDLYWARSKAYNKSAELGWSAYDGATKAAVKAHATSKVAYEGAKVYTSKATVEGQRIFDKNVKPQYEKHVKPHYEKHVNPLATKASKFVDKEITPTLQKIKTKIDPAVAKSQKFYRKHFNAAARNYGKACGSAYAAASDVAKERGWGFFETSVAPGWKASCRNPKDTVRTILLALLALLLLPWIFALVRLALRVVLLPARIFFYVVTLRFIFGGSSEKPAPAPAKKKVGGTNAHAKKDNNVRVKKKKGRSQ